MPTDIVWAFSLGHGHAAQFENFRESCPAELAQRSRWAGMSFTQSDDALANLSWIPGSIRNRRHEMWHLKRALQGGRKDDVLFLATWNLRILPYMWRYQSYFYVDFSPSLMRSMSPWYDHFFGHPAKQALRELAASALPHSAKGVITMSDWAARGIAADYGIQPGRIHTVLPGANLAGWHWVDRSERSSDTVRILMVGGEFKRKGGDLLINWARNTRASNVEVDIVTWPGQLPPEITTALSSPQAVRTSDKRVTVALGPELPNVRIHCGVSSNTAELRTMFAAADIFCLPTRADFSSIASLEAMATGLPVVVGGVGGVPELIEDGRTGFCVQPDHPTQLAQRLEALIEDRALRLEVGRRAREACERHYNIPRQMRQIAAIIDRQRHG